MRKSFKSMSVVLYTLIFTFVASVLAGCVNSGGGGSPVLYTVTFDSNGGSSVQSMQVNNGGTISSAPKPTREYYDFEGWYNSSGLTSKVSFPYKVTGNITLFAKWAWIDGYEIRTPSQLNNIRYNLAGEYTLAANISLAAYDNWVPIGSESDGAPFTGKINGNGYKITDLKIDEPTEAFAGLFGYVVGATITNLVLENVDIFSGSYAGAITGLAENSIIMDSHSTGGVISQTDAGGIVGYSYYSTITNSYSAGDILAYHYSGGIAGIIEGGTITDCYSTGVIVSYSESGGVTERASGGVAGYIVNSAITNSYSTGSILSFSNSGGITGLSFNSNITGSYSTGDVAAMFSSGGIVGAIWDGAITDSYSTGNIDNSEFSAGGLAGYVENSKISNCYGGGDISALSSAGGIVGFAGINTIITNCVAINGTISAEYYAGRVAGYIENILLVSNNFALDTMEATDATFNMDPMNHGVSKTDAEFKMQSTFSNPVIGDGLGGLGWKFGGDDNNPWKMPVGGGYPILYWQ